MAIILELFAILLAIILELFAILLAIILELFAILLAIILELFIICTWLVDYRNEDVFCSFLYDTPVLASAAEEGRVAKSAITTVISMTVTRLMIPITTKKMLPWLR